MYKQYNTILYAFQSQTTKFVDFTIIILKFILEVIYVGLTMLKICTYNI